MAASPIAMFSVANRRASCESLSPCCCAAVAAIAQVYAPRVLLLDPDQKAAFAGNAIALSPDSVWMSARAAASLRTDQRAALADWGFALHGVELGEIEKAGGSLRCCVGEIF